MRRLLLTLTWLTAALTAGAQNVYDLMELDMDSIVVKGDAPSRPGEVNAGARISRIGATVLQGNQTKSLSELLSDNSMIYIKSLGQGALSTSSFRGTSSSHTQVNWNGIGINPPMSSAFDFSQIPVFFADNVTLYHGNAHLKNGTGAVGGSVNISNTPDWGDSTRMRAFLEYGSFDTYTGAASVRFRGKKSLYRTRVFYRQSDNDFRYLNKVLQKDPFYERRKESQYKQTGVMQEAYFRPSPRSTVSTNLWFQYGKRHLPQPLVVNVTRHQKEQDTNLRYYLGYEYENGRHRLAVKGAYLLDYMDFYEWFSGGYLSSDRDCNTAQTLTFKSDYTYTPSARLSLDASLLYTRNSIDASSYSEGRAGRNVFSAQANASWRPWERLTLTGQVMGEVNDGRFAPTFSVGVYAPLAERWLSLRANAAYNYRFPSLNDLYWEPGGNPGLDPEKGFSYDATFVFTPKIGESLYFKAEATYYLMNIDDWIMWLPNREWYWEPRNVQNVLSHGLELSGECNWITPDLRAKLAVNYTYSPSVSRERNFEEDATYKKQLPYIPLHKANARLGADYKNFFLSYYLNYTGVRYTTSDEEYSTNAYTVHNAELGCHRTLAGKYKLTAKIRVDNLFNAYYESTQYYPMPLRSISGSLTFTF